MRWRPPSLRKLVFSWREFSGWDPLDWAVHFSCAPLDQVDGSPECDQAAPLPSKKAFSGNAVRRCRHRGTGNLPGSAIFDVRAACEAFLFRQVARKDFNSLTASITISIGTPMCSAPGSATRNLDTALLPPYAQLACCKDLYISWRPMPRRPRARTRA